MFSSESYATPTSSHDGTIWLCLQVCAVYLYALIAYAHHSTLHVTFAVEETNALQAGLFVLVRLHSTASQRPTPRLGKSIDVPSYLHRCCFQDRTLRESDHFSQKLPRLSAACYNLVLRIRSREISCLQALPTRPR